MPKERASAPIFQQIAREQHLPTRVAGEIARRIAGGEFAAGDRLPTEHLLANGFGVSRSVVREAIARLRNEGMVETRQGVGAFVADPQRRATIRVEHASLSEPKSLRDFFLLRLPLEIAAAQLAARNRTPGDLDALAQALREMNEAADWLAQGVRADLAFHRALAGATGNEHYETFLGFIAERFSSTIATAFLRRVDAVIVQVTIAEHTAIFEAVSAQDAPGAGEAMRAHLTGAADRLALTLDLS